MEDSSHRYKISSVHPIVSINFDPDLNLEFKDQILRAPSQNDGQAAADSAMPY